MMTSMIDPVRRMLREAIRDFFSDKPPGTTLTDDDMSAHYQRLRDITDAYPMDPDYTDLGGEGG